MAYADVNNGFLFLMLIWMYSLRKSDSTEVIFKKFNANETIENIVLHQQNIYIGCKNVIKMLSYTLEEKYSFVTGPKNDSQFCIPDSDDGLICPEGGSKTERLTDNVNKVLLVTNRPHQSLLVCGNVRQGSCRFLGLNDLKDISANISTTLFTKFVAPNEDVSAVSLLVEIDGKEELFVAKTITYIVSTVEYKFYPVAVLSLDVKDEKYLAPLDHGDVRTNYFMKCRTSQVSESSEDKKVPKAKCIVEYISIFSFKNFVYMTSVQKNNQSGKPRYHSKLIRISVSRELFGGYIEEALLCKRGSIVYNIIVSATFVKINGNLSTWYSSSSNDQVLIGLFAQSRDEQSRVVGSNYAICLFSLNEINKEFESQLNLCEKGQTNINFAKWFQSDSFCTVR